MITKSKKTGRFLPSVSRSSVLVYIEAMLAESAVPLRVGEIHGELINRGAPPIAEGTLRDYIRLAIKTNRIPTHNIIDGRLENRGTSATKRHKQQFKFQIGDKVRINPHPDKPLPKWLRDSIRLDIPRVICGIYRAPWREGIRHTRYYLNSNRNSLLKIYAFQPVELLPYVKGNIGRPKLKRHYNRQNGSTKGILPVMTNDPPSERLGTLLSISCVNRLAKVTA